MSMSEFYFLGQIMIKKNGQVWFMNMLVFFYYITQRQIQCQCLEGWTKELELVGVGYRATAQGQKLELALGFSHSIVMSLANEIKVETVSEKGANPIIKLSSFDKQLVGQVAAKIRSFRKPEPYKGKGIRFVGEQIRRKAGKQA